MPGNPLPDAEQLLQALIEQMRPAVGPETGLIGIHTGGVWVAERLHQALKLKTPAAALDVSPQTVQRDWRLAKVWLFREFSGGNPGAA